MPVRMAVFGLYQRNFERRSSGEVRYSSPSNTAYLAVSLRRTIRSKPSICAPTI